jgi:hypothetical protein
MSADGSSRSRPGCTTVRIDDRRTRSGHSGRRSRRGPGPPRPKPRSPPTDRDPRPRLGSDGVCTGRPFGRTKRSATTSRVPPALASPEEWSTDRMCGACNGSTSGRPSGSQMVTTCKRGIMSATHDRSRRRPDRRRYAYRAARDHSGAPVGCRDALCGSWTRKRAPRAARLATTGSVAFRVMRPGASLRRIARLRQIGPGGITQAADGASAAANRYTSTPMMPPTIGPTR